MKPEEAGQEACNNPCRIRIRKHRACSSVTPAKVAPAHASDPATFLVDYSLLAPNGPDSYFTAY